MDEIGDLCFVILHSHGLWARTVTQRALVVLRLFLLSCHIQPLPSHFYAGEKSHFTGH